MQRFLRTYSTLLLAFMVLFGGQSQAWDFVVRDNIKYVSMSEIRSRYGFTSQRKEGNTWVYEASAKKVQLKLRSGSQDMFANTFKFVLSYPAVEDPVKGMLVSYMDVVKIFHPILLPSHISSVPRIEKIILDPGHGGHDAGAKNRISLEKDLNLAVARKIKRNLEQLGFDVVMTRETDKFLSLKERVEIANRYRNAIFISVHHNSGKPSARGLETFTLAPAGTSTSMSKTVSKTPMAGNTHDSANIALATAIQTRMLKDSQQRLQTKLEDRGIKRARFSVLCTIKHPAILVECGFMSNPQEAEMIRSEKYQNYIASAVAQGVMAYNSQVVRKNTASVDRSRPQAQMSASRMRAEMMR